MYGQTLHHDIYMTTNSIAIHGMYGQTLHHDIYITTNR